MTRAMYRLTLTALAVAVFAGGAWAFNDDHKCKKTCKKHCKSVVVVTGDRGDDETVEVHSKVICIKTDDQGGDGAATWVIKPGDDEEEVVVKLNVSAHGGHGWTAVAPLILTAGGAGDPDRGWLGVGLGEVPPALAAQLGTEGQGVMITNVVTDSPAAKAGLERYDIVTVVNGEPVDGSVSALAEAVGEAGPSARVTLTVIHNGKEETVRATLGSRPPNQVVWEHDLDWLPSISEKFRTRGKVLKLMPGGGVTLHDLGDLKDLADLPDSIRDLIPDIDDIITSIHVDKELGDVTTHIKTRVHKDGQTFELEFESDGQITVRRTTVDEDGNTETTEKVYESAEELEAADEEAFEMFSKVQGRHLSGLDVRHPGMFKISVNLDDLEDKLEDLDVHVDIQDSVKDAMAAYEEAMKSLKGMPLAKYYRFKPHTGLWFGDPREATHNFSVDSDGRIAIRIRKGDSEVVLNYKNENDLRKRNPEMYEKYMDVMETPVDD